MAEWLPIETYRVVHGKPVLVFGSSDKKPTPQMARVALWSNGWVNRDTFERIGGWQSHWMPIPADPKWQDDDED